MSKTEQKTIEEIANKDYKYGFVTDIDSDTLPIGLNENTVKQISKIKHIFIPIKIYNESS